MGNHTPETSFPCPYVLGATFKLEVSPQQGDPFVVEAKIDHVYSPFTMSSVMRVTLSSEPAGPNLPPVAILKVYDRRFANTVREEYEIGPPTHEQEDRYAEYIATGNVSQTEDHLWELIEAIPETDPDPLELNEHVAALVAQEYFKNEITTYETLSGLQGTYIPIFYGTTKFLADSSTPYLDTNVPGILIEFIPGTNLSKIDPSKVDLGAIFTTAVWIVNAYSDLNVLNSDIRFENFIVKPNGSEIVMIDFGHCRLRKDDEDDQAWKEAKWSQDEEGAVGVVGKHKYGWNYVPSRRFEVRVDTTGMKVQRIDSKTGKSDYYYL